MTDDGRSDRDDQPRELSSEEMIREARDDVYDDDPLEGYVPPPMQFDHDTAAGSPGPTVAAIPPDPVRTSGSDPDPGADAPNAASSAEAPPTAYPGAAADGPVAERSRWGTVVRALVVIALFVVGGFVVRNLFDSGTHVSTLEPGDCFLDVEGTEVSSVETVECAEPHHYEVFANVTLPEGDYPGRAAVDQQGFDGCLEQFTPYVGSEYESSVWYITTFVPLEESWSEDRVVNCLLYQPDPDDPTTPSLVTGSGRDTAI